MGVFPGHPDRGALQSMQLFFVKHIRKSADVKASNT